MQRITKENAEETIIQRFTETYSLTCGIDLVDVSPRGVNNPPDFEAKIEGTGERIGIEATGLYQNPLEAMINYSEITLWNTFAGSLDEIALALNCLLEK